MRTKRIVSILWEPLHTTVTRAYYDGSGTHVHRYVRYHNQNSHYQLREAAQAMDWHCITISPGSYYWTP